MSSSYSLRNNTLECRLDASILGNPRFRNPLLRYIHSTDDPTADRTETKPHVRPNARDKLPLPASPLCRPGPPRSPILFSAFFLSSFFLSLFLPLFFFLPISSFHLSTYSLSLTPCSFSIHTFTPLSLTATPHTTNTNTPTTPLFGELPRATTGSRSSRQSRIKEHSRRANSC